MAYGIKLAGANLAYKGGVLNGTRYLGLLRTETNEFTSSSQGGYARVAMALADWQKVTGAGARNYENMAQEIFGPPTGAAWPAIVGFGLYSAATGGDLLWNVDVTDTGAPGIGASTGTDAGDSEFGFTAGGNLTPAGSFKCLDEGLLSGTRRLVLHSGATPVQANSADGSGDTDGNAMNTDGTVGAASGKSLVSVAAAAGDWDLDSTNTNTRRRARNNKILSYGIQGSNLPDPMSVALRAGNAHDSDILMWWPVTSEDPGLGDALQFAANAISASLTYTA